MFGVIVWSTDQFGDTSVVGQRVFPIGGSSTPGLRKGDWLEYCNCKCKLLTMFVIGYRSVPLNDIHGQSLGLSSVLLHVDVQFGAAVDKAKQDRREKVRKLEAERSQILQAMLTHKDDQAFQSRAQVKLEVLSL